MQCPHCSSLVMRGDTACPRCGRNLVQNHTRSLVSNGVALACALAMFVLITCVLQPKDGNTPIGAFVTGLFCLAALGVGKLIGWVIGAFVTD